MIGALLIVIVLFSCPSFYKVDSMNTTKVNKPMENRSNNYSIPLDLEECEEIDSEVEKEFCIGDVAEIKNNQSLCKKIADKSIRNFCIARITLNRTKCETLNDEDLYESCIQSINLKQEWKGS